MSTGVVLVTGSAPAAIAADVPSPSPGQSSSPSPSTSPSTSSSPTDGTTPPGDGTTGTPGDGSSSPPDGGDSGSPPPPATLSLAFSHLPTSVQPGKSYDADLNLTPHFPSKDSPAPKNVEVTVSGSHAAITCVASNSRVDPFSTVQSAKLIAVKITVASDLASGTITVSAHVDSDNVSPANAKSVTIKVKKSTSSGGGSTSGGSSGSGSNGGTSGGSTGSTGSTGSNVGASSGLGSAPPSGISPGTGTTGTNGTGIIPQLPSAQTPSTAPDPTTVVQPAGNDQSMRSTAEGSDELSFNQLASTQAAWLAALLVAFSLLLTQVRLGRGTAKGSSQKGTHRKQRRSAGRFRAS